MTQPKPKSLRADRRAMTVTVLSDTSHEAIQQHVMNKIVNESSGLVYSEGQWWTVGPLGAWERMPEERIWNEIRELNGLETQERANAKQGKKIQVNAGMCQSVCRLARARFYEADAFAACSPGFITPAGLWSCSPAIGWEVRRPEPSDRVRLWLDVDPDLHGQPERWLKVLSRVWAFERSADESEAGLQQADLDARVAFLHEWLAATLVGEATRHQKAPILVGDGENGKSVIIDVVAGMVPAALRASVTPDALETNRFASATLVGKALNCVAEIPGGELLTSATIKGIIDGSEQQSERKGVDAFTFAPRAGHIFAANALPRVRDLSHGFMRRWVILTSTGPRISAKERNPFLSAQIIASERAQILGYAMRYHHARVADGRGYTEVPSSQEALKAWRAESDNVQQWVEDATTPGGVTTIKALYSAYRQYTHENACIPVSLKTFGLRLALLGYPADRDRAARTRGLTIGGVTHGDACVTHKSRENAVRTPP